jgi:hydrocephalus-inducing protein
VEGDQDQTTFIRGANMLDLGGDSGKEYKLSFMAYKVGVYKFMITFKNDATGEYLFYKMQVQATEPDLIERIELASAIRESISKIVTIENPTDQEVTIARNQFVFTNEYIDITPDSLKIPPKSERGFEINYRPLKQTEEEVDLVLKNPTLGDYKYKLLLKGLPAST